MSVVSSEWLPLDVLFQLNVTESSSSLKPRNTLNVSHKECCHQAEKWTSAGSW